MRGTHPGEVWLVDFLLAAKVRPALLLTSEPATGELDLVTVCPTFVSLLLCCSKIRFHSCQFVLPRRGFAALGNAAYIFLVHLRLFAFICGLTSNLIVLVSTFVPSFRCCSKIRVYLCASVVKKIRVYLCNSCLSWLNAFYVPFQFTRIWHCEAGVRLRGSKSVFICVHLCSSC